MHPQTAAWLKDLDFTDSEEVHLTANCKRAALSSELILTGLLPNSGHPVSPAYWFCRGSWT